jgi:hypothetical protein
MEFAGSSERPSGMKFPCAESPVMGMTVIPAADSTPGTARTAVRIRSYAVRTLSTLVLRRR